MKLKPNPDEIAADQQQDFDATACSAEFSQGCIEPEDQE